MAVAWDLRWREPASRKHAATPTAARASSPGQRVAASEPKWSRRQRVLISGRGRGYGGAVGQAHEDVQRPGGSGPVLAQQLWPAGSHQGSEYEHDDDRVVELAGDRDEVGNEVERHREITDQDGQ